MTNCQSSRTPFKCMSLNLWIPRFCQKEKVESNLAGRKRWLLPLRLKTRIFTKPNGFVNWDHIFRVLITTGLLVKCVIESGTLQVTRAARVVEGHDKDSTLHMEHKAIALFYSQPSNSGGNKEETIHLVNWISVIGLNIL